MISVRLQGKPFNITVFQVYAPTSNAEEAEVERFYEDLQDLLELTHQFKLIKKAVESNQLDGKRKCRVLVDTPERKSYCVWVWPGGHLLWKPGVNKLLVYVTGPCKKSLYFAKS